ncbi:hypothetical protein FNV43_RR04205 [Rhamnella rubrinervis]|uniref:Uncharacterized protein n=1 Tax=Rhamnella rubrinervis TaxID=2594499 RepID=A0A8K0HLE4_9ROSA|nr:hypothetical protein FNV43_RR04205 [Rhamnella rubrinervis]
MSSRKMAEVEKLDEGRRKLPEVRGCCREAEEDVGSRKISEVPVNCRRPESCLRAGKLLRGQRKMPEVPEKVVSAEGSWRGQRKMPEDVDWWSYEDDGGQRKLAEVRGSCWSLEDAGGRRMLPVRKLSEAVRKFQAMEDARRPKLSQPHGRVKVARRSCRRSWLVVEEAIWRTAGYAWRSGAGLVVVKLPEVRGSCHFRGSCGRPQEVREGRRKSARAEEVVGGQEVAHGRRKLLRGRRSCVGRMKLLVAEDA